ncbi:MAG: AAA family ATPase [Spirochaetes bacterium RBG_13_68_11]|nr:MAG: AAA family ATPase [Spirochaetes bacterium RBG_13_68_11]
MDLFGQETSASGRGQPLAARMRPRTVEEFVGQDHILGPGRLLRRAIQADQLSSLIFYGPPGTGKTTLARVIANTTRSLFQSLNAVLAGVKDIREATAAADERRKLYGRRTTLFVDEVHRWNKAQQDALLPWVENGTIVLIGATTGNPYFEVNPALVSRSRIFQLLPLTGPDLHRIAEAALADAERGYGGLDVSIDTDALDHLVDVSSGDARTLLNALELAVETTPSVFPPPPGEPIVITRSIAEESIQRRAVLYDKEGDYHFDTISAFIKSLRGSDPDAALYWLARMVYAGEDPRFIFRRMLILASEDVGMADPGALVFVEAAAAAYERVGLPEGRYHLAHAALRLANAPKSNSAMGFFDALAVVEKEQPGEVPVHLKDDSRDSEGFGHGEGYLYPHAYRDHWVAQQYLPDRLQGRLFYQPSDQGYERDIRTDVQRRREAQLEAIGDAEERPVEVLTFTRARSGRDQWLERAAGRSSRELAALRDRLFAAAAPARHHLVLDLAAGEGLLTWEALRRVPEGGVWALASSAAQAAALGERSSALGELDRPHVLAGRLTELPALLGGADSPRFDAAVGRNCLLREPDKAGSLAAIAAVLRPGGRLCVAETLPSRGQWLSEVLDLASMSPDAVERLRQAEAEVYRAPGDPLTGWDERSLAADAAAAGLVVTGVEVESATGPRFVRDEDIERWFSGAWGSALARSLSAAELDEVRRICRVQLAGREVSWRTATLFLTAQKSGG